MHQMRWNGKPTFISLIMKNFMLELNIITLFAIAKKNMNSFRNVEIVQNQY